MKKRTFVFLLFIFIVLSTTVFSHGGEDEYILDNSEMYPLTQLEAVGYGSLIFGVLVIIILLFQKKMSEDKKKAVYMLVAIVVGVVTIYIITITLHLNMNSVTNGPVHWHADFEIWVCDDEVFLAKPQQFLSNKQGTDLMHAHDDNRIHAEGVLTDYQQASLGTFFHAVGGSLSNDGLQVPTEGVWLSVHDGSICNGQPAKLYVFVNGKLIENPQNYIIQPYEKVPPGDRIKIIFTEKPVEQINPNIN